MPILLSTLKTCLVPLVMFVFVTSCCRENPETKLVGKWVYIESETGEELSLQREYYSDFYPDGTMKTTGTLRLSFGDRAAACNIDIQARYFIRDGYLHFVYTVKSQTGYRGDKALIDTMRAVHDKDSGTLETRTKIQLITENRFILIDEKEEGRKLVFDRRLSASHEDAADSSLVTPPVRK